MLFLAALHLRNRLPCLGNAFASLFVIFMSFQVFERIKDILLKPTIDINKAFFEGYGVLDEHM